MVGETIVLPKENLTQHNNSSRKSDKELPEDVNGLSRSIGSTKILDSERSFSNLKKYFSSQNESLTKTSSIKKIDQFLKSRYSRIKTSAGQEFKATSVPSLGGMCPKISGAHNLDIKMSRSRIPSSKNSSRSDFKMRSLNSHEKDTEENGTIYLAAKSSKSTTCLKLRCPSTHEIHLKLVSIGDNQKQTEDSVKTPIVSPISNRECLKINQEKQPTKKNKVNKELDKELSKYQKYRGILLFLMVVHLFYICVVAVLYKWNLYKLF